jgi:hypothetical protein
MAVVVDRTGSEGGEGDSEVHWEGGGFLVRLVSFLFFLRRRQLR